VKKTVRIGTRKSKLALVQTDLVIKTIKQVHSDIDIQLVPMTTAGDKILNKALDDFGGKGAFISEFEDALLSGKIDLAVHSAKDMPVTLPDGLNILAVSQREDIRDVLVTKKGFPLKEGGIVGTSSLRRSLQIKELYNVQTKSLRGNVETRLLKLKNKEYDAIILAAAGLKRLNLLEREEFRFEFLNEDMFIPAAGQGIIAVEGRKEEFLSRLLSPFHHIQSMYCLETEREVLKLLNAGCNTPIGVYASIHNDRITLSIAYPYKNKMMRKKESAAIKDRFLLAQDFVRKIRGEYE